MSVAFLIDYFHLCTLIVGLDIDGIDVFLDNNKTPLPLLTSETNWLSGRTLRIKSKCFNFICSLRLFSEELTSIFRGVKLPIELVNLDFTLLSSSGQK